MRYIKVRGARTHNLKNIDVDIPRDELVVITGVSGSGKSSLAFDTLYAEGQRRYVESLSSYARQFLELMGKADVDLIEGLTPSIAIEQKVSNRNPRSTVGTSTEINDYLRLLFARAGVPVCPRHGHELRLQNISEMADAVLGIPAETRILVLAPIFRTPQPIPRELLADLQHKGYMRIRIDDAVLLIEDAEDMDLTQPHRLDLVVDRFRVRPDARQRIVEAFEQALAQGKGIASVLNLETGEKRDFSNLYACPECGYTVPELEPKMFSFNNPSGSCPDCHGMGLLEQFDPQRIVAFPDLSLASGAIEGWDSKNKYNFSQITDLSRALGFDAGTPWNELPEKVRNIILYGSEESFSFGYEGAKGQVIYRDHPFEGIIRASERRYGTTENEGVREKLQAWRSVGVCPTCRGQRLGEVARNVFIGTGADRKSISELSNLPLSELDAYFSRLQIEGNKKEIGQTLIHEIRSRLKFLIDVGVSYLTLDRRADTLSGGEAQRIRLAGQIGSGLSGVMYVLDEPSIGLHQVDNDRLIRTLQALRDLGNTVIVVEHDEDTIRAADYVLDLGPEAGTHGGKIIAMGTPKEICADPESLTGAYLSGQRQVFCPQKKKEPDGRYMRLKGACGHNLKNVTLEVPVGLMVAITGVSGSGKSTLINETLYPIAARQLNRANTFPLPYDAIEGLEYFDKVLNVDQSPIGRTPRSNPATYTGVFSAIRELFAEVPLAKERGYGAGRFSFNVKGGRCEACEGEGLVKVEMNFLPDVYVPCDVCRGSRYNRETLDVLYKGFNIAQILSLTVENAYEVFKAVPTISRKLKTLIDVGLGYVQLGQSATTLSGGESQRMKLAQELSKRSTGKTLYILDEPTTGLHFKDVDQLLQVLVKIRDAGNTLVIIEHNLDVVRAADWIIDMGPSGGSEGGRIVAEGTPEDISRSPSSETGKYLGNLKKL